MGIRQLKNCVIIFIVFFCGSVLGLKTELVTVTILSAVILPFIYLVIVLIMIIYSQIDYDEIKALYNYLEDINKEKVKIQISFNMDRESLEDNVMEYNAQLIMLSTKLIIDAEHYLANKRYKRFIPKELYEMKKEKIEIIVEKTKKIIREN